MGKKIIDFKEKREEAINKRRRELERIMFHDYLGVYSLIELDENSEEDETPATPVEILDISASGLMFKAPIKPDKKSSPFQMGQTVRIRIYMGKKSYLPINVSIVRSEPLKEEGIQYLRYGGEFDQTMASYEAIKCFVDFISKFAEHSKSERSNDKKAI